ncbi:MAG: 5-deoxy-glucuronate isomerase, partial [Pedococcus sp.]
MSDNARWVRPLGTAADRGWDVVVDDAVQGWQHTGLYVARLAAGERRDLTAGEWEHVVVPLSGSVTVESEGDRAVLAGRASVFAGPTDVAYVARDRALAVVAHDGPARVAVCAA